MPTPEPYRYLQLLYDELDECHEHMDMAMEDEDDETMTALEDQAHQIRRAIRCERERLGLDG